MKIFCIVVERGALNDHTREVLFSGAVRLCRTKQEACHVQDANCEGDIRTEFRHAQLGGISGIKFAAFLDTDRGTIQATYIIRPRELEAALACPDDLDHLHEGTDRTWTTLSVGTTADERATYDATPPHAGLDN